MASKEAREGKRKRTISSRLVARLSEQSSATTRRSEQQRRRLDALENDNALADERAAVLGEEDEEYTMTTPEEIAEMGPCFKGVRRGMPKAGKRQTRAARDEKRGKRTRGYKSFAVLLEESGLEESMRRKEKTTTIKSIRDYENAHKSNAGGSATDAEETVSVHDALESKYNYVTAAAGPSKWTAARKFCSVCGFPSTYTCVQCAARICSRKCNVTHTETRCLKFVVS